MHSPQEALLASSLYFVFIEFILYFWLKKLYKTNVQKGA